MKHSFIHSVCDVIYLMLFLKAYSNFLLRRLLLSASPFSCYVDGGAPLYYLSFAQVVGCSKRDNAVCFYCII